MRCGGGNRGTLIGTRSCAPWLLTAASVNARIAPDESRRASRYRISGYRRHAPFCRQPPGRFAASGSPPKPLEIVSQQLAETAVADRSTQRALHDVDVRTLV